MKKILVICMTILITMGLSSCGSSRRNMIPSYNDLSGEWDVIEMNGKVLNPETTGQYFVFDTYQNTVSGNAGCNRISGRVEYNPMQPGIIRFMQVASTRMACLDDQKTAWENEFLKTMPDVVRFGSLSAEGTTPRIALYSIDNSRLFILRKKK